jgi:hypothetical protein
MSEPVRTTGRGGGVRFQVRREQDERTERSALEYALDCARKSRQEPEQTEVPLEDAA